MHFRSPRPFISVVWVIVLGLLVMVGFISRGRHENPLRSQSFEALETRMRVAGKQAEESAHLLNAVHQTTQNLGIGSTLAARKIEEALANRVRVRESERIEAQSEIVRLRTLAEMSAGRVPINDSGGVGR
jgi:hypothetical protein